MTVTVTIDSAGRLVIPKALRRQFRLRTGSRLTIEVNDDHLTLYPVDLKPALTLEDGWWVHEGEPVEDLLEFLDEHRKERLEDLSK